MFQATLVSNSDASKYAYGMTMKSQGIFLAWLAENGGTVSSRQGSNGKVSTGQKGSRGPSMASRAGTPHIAYRDGSSGTSGAPILAGPYDGSKWSMSPVITAANDHPKTDQPVSLSPFGNDLYMAYKQSDHTVGISWFNGTQWQGYANSEHAIANNANPKVAANGNSHGDDYVITSRGPSIANLAVNSVESLYLAFKENGGKGHVYFGSSTKPSDPRSWNNLARLGKAYKTNGTPALAAWNGKIVLVFPNAEESNRLYTAVFNPSSQSWSELAVIKDGGTPLDPGNDKETAATNVSLIGDDANRRLFVSFVQDKKIRLYSLIEKS